MRIIAGEFRRRLLATPADDSVTRPIPDRVKESVFGLLRGHCEGATVFDGFSGTGAIGLEAISRGAAHCVCVERDKHIGEILRKNVQTLGVEDRCEVVVGDALGPGALARAPRPLKLAFLDPPYPLVEEPIGFRRVMVQLGALVDLLSPDGYAVLRTPWPLRHSEASDGAVGEPTPHDGRGRPHKKKGKDRRTWKRDLERAESPRHTSRTPRVDAMSDEEVEWLDVDDQGRLVDGAGEVVPDDAFIPDAPASKPQWTVPSLVLPNAKGPETHEYRGMAVHLYMRR
ncbi:MAG: RsmD family RNA methyltransferase [Phycisphaerales bacterium]